jgi:protocatechuate 3,4-dioxygenase beta subunit
MMPKLFSLFSIFLLVTLVGRGQEKFFPQITTSESKEWKAFQQISLLSQVQLTDDNEPGEKLILCITYLDKTRNTPIKDQKVLLYQTAEDGEYHPEIEGDEKTARIKGTGYTDENGRLYVETILPGNYAPGGDRRHIHTWVYGAQIKTYDLFFKQFLSERMKNIIKGGFRFSLIDLKRTKNQELIGFVTVTVKNPE